VHLLAWPMGELVLPGYADKVQYAQLLHDASELRTSARRNTTWISEEASARDLVVRLPILKPDVEIPVVELFLK
jgi:alpha-L-fucosidase